MNKARNEQRKGEMNQRKWEVG